MSSNNSCFIITGTSRGIGEALAKMLLENNHNVYGISRSDSSLSDYKNYQHAIFDLGDTDKIGRMMSEIMYQISTSTDFDMICLVNNAAILEPIKAIEQADAAEISKSINVNLIAPIVMASQFIERTKEFTIRRKIVNISSGSGTYPAADMSIYSTTKAGLNMFTRCIGVEQAGNENPVEIIAVDPGMVETEMQRTARGKNADEFKMAGFFKEAHTNGELQSTEEIALHLHRIIYTKYEIGKIVNYCDQ